MRRVLWAVGIVVGLPLVVVIWLGADILLYSLRSDTTSAHAAIVLGAAVADDDPTPVFEERLRHAVALHTSGQVKFLLMTGGKGPGDALSEGAAGRDWAIAAGVPPEAILVEEASHTTVENLKYAVPILAERGLSQVLVVSDPLHMRRAITIAERLGIDAHPSPTPTTRFQTLGTQLPMLAREIWFTAQYLVTGN